MDAWIDCMSDLDQSNTGMISKNSVPLGHSIVFYIEHYKDLR
jgi:hypothetical protein